MKSFTKRSLCALISALILISLVPVAFATPGTSSHVSVSTSPSEVSQEGDVTVYVTLTNTNTAPAVTPEPEESPIPDESEDVNALNKSGGGAYTDIVISNAYGVSFETTGVVIPAGESYTFSGTMHVTTSMIGTSLSFNVTWDDNGTSRSESASTIIVRADTAYLRVTRDISHGNASAGTVVTFTYTFVNTGSVKLNSITLIDRYVSGSSTRPLLEPFSLDPGQSTEYRHELTMGSSSITSTPVVTFVAQGNSTSLVVNVPSRTVGLINSQVTKEVVRGTATPEGVPFTLYFTNNGNQKLSSLMVKDELGNSLVDSVFSLAIGETKVIECFIPNPTGIRNVVFKITGVDASGTSFSDNTESFVVSPYIDVSLLKLSFTAKMASPLNEENVIGLEFTLTNEGSLPYSNIVLTEKELGYDLHTWLELAPGATETIKLDINAGGERELVFVLTSHDSSGNEYIHEAYLSAAYTSGEDMVPIDDPESGGSTVDVIDDNTGLGTKLDDLLTGTGEKLLKWSKVLGIIAIIAVVAIIALIIVEYVIRRNKLKSKRV